MIEGITVAITTAAVVRVGLLWAAEYAMLSMIEDSPEILKAATLICAVLGLAVLQFREKIEGWSKKSFMLLAIGVSAIYLIFVAYAINHWLERVAIHNHLRQLYTESGALVDRKVGTDPSSGNQVYDAAEVDKFVASAQSWEDNTSQWLVENIGPAAKERFSDVSSLPSYCWGPLNDGTNCSIKLGNTKNRLVALKRNLSVLIETSAYE